MAPPVAPLPALIAATYSWDMPLTRHPPSDVALARVRSLSLEPRAPAAVLASARYLRSQVSRVPLVAGSQAAPRVRSWLRARSSLSLQHLATALDNVGERNGPSFSQTLPPPYRLLFLVASALGLWWAILALLTRLPLPIVPSSNAQPHTMLQRRVGMAAVLCAAWTTFGWASFRTYVALDGDPRGRHAQVIQGICVLGAAGALLWPGDMLARPMRASFGRHLLRILSPKLTSPPVFTDVLLADILTSFAKVLGDAWLTACFLWPRKNHHVWWNGRGSLMVPLLASLPYAIRLRQCLAEYVSSRGTQPVGHPDQNGSSGYSYSSISGYNLRAQFATRPIRPLLNAAKYASAFPVIWLSAIEGTSKGDDSPEGIPGVWAMWLLSVFVNSLFSFWWDVTNDWGLDLFRPAKWFTQSLALPSSSGTQPLVGKASLHKRGLSSLPIAAQQPPEEELPTSSSGSSINSTLRAPSSSGSSSGSSHGGVKHSRSPSFLRAPSVPMLFSPAVYHLAVLFDLALRFAWSLKLSSHLSLLTEIEAGIFALEALEIARRMAWCVLRIEWEHVKTRAWEREMRGEGEEED